MVRLENVGVRYGQGAEILKDVNFRLGVGDFAFLTGPSGAGKSTYLRLLFLALKPTRGTISMFGENVAAIGRDRIPSLRRRIGVVHQDCQFLDHLPLAANVTLPLTVAGKEADPGDLTALLAWVGLGSLGAALPPQLSGGERQRAALVLCYYQDRSNIEAAEILGISVDALESLLSRARRTLKSALSAERADLLSGLETG